MLLQVLFLKDLSFAICEKMAPISSWEPKQFLFNFKGKISWGKKKISSKSAHHTALCQSIFVAFSDIHQKTAVTVALLSSCQLAFPAFL